VSLFRRRPVDPARPGPGQESVWDYPRPPRLEPVDGPVRVEFAGEIVAETRSALRVCETASPPCYYVPPEDVRTDLVEPAAGRSYCEWKGSARYWTVRVGDRVSDRAAWSYPDPNPAFEALRDYIAFYAGRVDVCWVGEDRVTPQPGRFYGGWITPDLVGPFKGEPGTEGW
jgi:uncharacterized protein (DUF427 family)